MTDVEFYSGLNYDFYIHEQDKKLNGLTPYGFTDNHRPLNVKEFNTLELNAARDMLSCYLRQIKSYNKSITSYGLKHLIEHALAIETDNAINYVSNGTLILAMYDYGFKIKRTSYDSPNCYFNLSQKSLNDLRRFIMAHK